MLEVQSGLIDVSYDGRNTAAVAAAKLNKKQKCKHKHTIAKIYFLCVFHVISQEICRKIQELNIIEYRCSRMSHSLLSD